MNIPKETGQIVVGEQNILLFVKILRKLGITAGEQFKSDIAGRVMFRLEAGSWESGVAQGVARALDEISMLNTIKRADNPLSKIGTKALVEVHGFVMLRGVDKGKYRIEVAAWHGLPSYRFYRPKGKKVIAHHFASSVDSWIRYANDEDLNKIVIL